MDQTVNRSMTPAAGFRRPRSLRPLFMKYLNPVVACPYVLLAPAMILCLMFSLLPVAYVIRSSFYQIDFVMGTESWVGLQNFRSIFSDADFLQAVGNTLIFTFFTVGIGISLALALAVFLNKNRAVYNLVQSIVYTPHIISYTSIAVLFMFLMDPQTGIFNLVLDFFGLPQLKWMLSEKTSLLSIIIVFVWKMLGYNIMIILAALQSVPREVYEAAKMDRAGQVKTFFHVTIPMISPTLVFLITNNVTSSFCSFDIIDLMTKGGPKNSSNMMVYWIYENAFSYYRVGPAMAGAVVLLMLVGSISVLVFTISNRKAHY